MERERVVLDKRITKIKTDTLSSILDNSTKAHKKDINIITNGYLNPNSMLKAYKDENEKLIDLLEEYDVVKNRSAPKRNSTVKDEPVVQKTFSKAFVPAILPNQYLNVTKADQFKTFRMIDQALVEKSLMHAKGAVRPKEDKLRLHLERIEKELSELEDPNVSERLQVYSRAWENIIDEFKTFGPLLSKIKVF